MTTSKNCKAKYHYCGSDRESLINAGYQADFINNTACECRCHTEEAK